MIPEAAYVVTSACYQRRKKVFRTHLSEFSYDYIPCVPYFCGVEYSQHNGGALIASPVKALFDLIYVKRKKYSSLNELEADLRVDIEELRRHVTGFRYAELEAMAASYKKRNLQQFHKTIVRELM